MAQHDYDIANQSGANFRADLNNALDAIVSNNSGSSEPSTTFAYEWWIDTSANVLKLRNSANNAWITLPLSITADNSTSGALTVNGNLTTTGTIDVNGQELILDADADTSITADTDDQIDFKIGGTDVATLTNSHFVLKGTTPKITIGDGGEEDTALIFDGNAQDFYIGLDDSADDLVIGKGSTVGTTPAIVIDENLNVGIGTSSPQRPLHLHGDTSGDIIFSMTNNSTGATTSDGFNIIVEGPTPDVLFRQRESSNMRFLTNNTERVRIDSAGRFMIGTTTEGQADADDLTVANASGNVGISLRTTTTGYASIYFSDATSGGAEASGAVQYKHDDNFLRFTTAESERMRITSAGHLLIGTTSAVADSRLRVKSSGSSASEYTCEMGSADGTTQLLIRSDGAFFTGTDSNSPFNSAGASANVQVLSNGALTRVTSSRRYKQDITDATWGLDEVKQLRPVTFRSNRTDELCDPNVHGGFIAEEVHDIGGLTSFIGYDENDEAETLHYANMVSLLTKAIQEQQEIIEDLKSRIETLEG